MVLSPVLGDIADLLPRPFDIDPAAGIVRHAVKNIKFQLGRSGDAALDQLGDIALAEPGTIIGFAGARVIEETIREKLPEGFQRAEYLLEHGMIDMVVSRHDLAGTLGRIIDLIRRKTLGADVVPIAQENDAAAGGSDDEQAPATD